MIVLSFIGCDRVRQYLLFRVRMIVSQPVLSGQSHPEQNCFLKDLKSRQFVIGTERILFKGATNNIRQQGSFATRWRFHFWGHAAMMIRGVIFRGDRSNRWHTRNAATGCNIIDSYIDIAWHYAMQRDFKHWQKVTFFDSWPLTSCNRTRSGA